MDGARPARGHLGHPAADRSQSRWRNKATRDGGSKPLSMADRSHSRQRIEAVRDGGSKPRLANDASPDRLLPTGRRNPGPRRMVPHSANSSWASTMLLEGSRELLATDRSCSGSDTARLSRPSHPAGRSKVEPAPTTDTIPSRSVPMDDDQDLKDFNNVCRLFPLPGRGLLSPRRPAAPHLRAAIPTDDRGRPRVGPAGRDRPGPAAGRVGLALRADPGRVRLPRPDPQARAAAGRPIQLPPARPEAGPAPREVPSGTLYRTPRSEIIEDVPPTARTSRCEELIAPFRRLRAKGTLDPDLDVMFQGDLPLGVLTDIVAQAMGLPGGGQARIPGRGQGQPGGPSCSLELLRQITPPPPEPEPEEPVGIPSRRHSA